MSTVGILGLGLIGGSFAKAYHAAGWTVLAEDRDAAILSFAQMSGAVDRTLGAENAAQCDLILACICPEAAIAELTGLAPHIGEKPVVIDCCGTKRVVCEALFPVAEQYGFTYLGGHPMAGSHHSGFKYARENLYHNAPMVLVPPSFDDIALLQRVKELLAPAGFGHISVTTAQAHDEMIAFTSQMPHLISNAYIKSPTAAEHKGFSAGSYKDMTRVAWLNAPMWAELFLENRDCLLRELGWLMESLREYRAALEKNDLPELTRLLEEGKKRKEEVDGR
ncbi:MAG: prephenate dehydrogenase [Firmicutes bacterium]|nr:prephenate dehydrogenase [Bacillota bacterium]MDY2808301.1 prephenate dehydrogenase [Oscillospiraceae bacterium]